MRPRVSGMVWLPKREIDSQLITHLRKELTVIPRKAKGYDDVKSEPIRCYKETPFEFGVPRAFWFQTANKPYEYNWDVSFGHEWDESPECILTHEGPYEEQSDIVDLFADRFYQCGPDVSEDEEPTSKRAGLLMGGIFQADTGFGKTDTTIGLVNRIQRTTLVIVHKEFLQSQWIDRAEKWLPGVKIGIVREDKCDFEGKHIVVAMAQSLALDKGDRYPQELYDWPAFVVTDETHRIGAPTWAPTLPKFSAAWRLGLTATPRRHDGADKVFWWHIGQIVYKAKTETPKPNVRMIKVKAFSLPPVMKRDNVKAPLIINILVKLKKRNRVAVNEMVKALKAPTKRKLFVLSERLDHLRKMEEALQVAWKEECVAGGVKDEDLTTGFYVGEWFTGETKPKLSSRSWPMKDGGRKKAIDTIYRSLSRRWKPVEKLGDLKPMISVSKKDMSKKHHVFMEFGDYAAIAGIVTDIDEDKEWIHVKLEDLEDTQLYDLAKMFDISQKKTEKKRRQTKAELHEAERARVVFATYQMCAEGVDIPAIDSEFLISPISDVQQANGRIRRYCLPKKEKCEHYCPWRTGECKGKPAPIVCDIVDLGVPLASKRERYRRDYYATLGTVVSG